MENISERLYGIHEVHRSTESKPEIEYVNGLQKDNADHIIIANRTVSSIVAVHGLNGDARRTWTARDSDVSWLSHPEFLPKYVKRARVLVWGYNASFSSLTGDKVSKNRIHNHAHTLVANLSANRQLAGMTRNPIIFICHSLGGIVVKRALAYAQTRTGNRVCHELDIFTSTYGIMFFGTPHKGSSKATLLASVKKIASILAPSPIKVSKSDLVLALEEESETLQNITDFFVPIMKHFAIFFFWEQQKTDLKFLGKDFIVPCESAAPLYDDTERAGIAADHSGLVKFNDPTSHGFRLVMDALMRYCDDAHDTITQRRWLARDTLGQERGKEIMEILRHVRPPGSGQYPALGVQSTAASPGTSVLASSNSKSNVSQNLKPLKADWEL